MLRTIIRNALGRAEGLVMPRHVGLIILHCRPVLVHRYDRSTGEHAEYADHRRRNHPSKWVFHALETA
jgi:hypothetical protein